MTKRGTYKNCLRCKKVFYEYPFEKGKRKYCCWDCSNKSTAKIQVITKRNKSIETVASKLSDKWRHTWAYEDWRTRVMSRDGFRCVECRKSSKKSLIVHHVKSYKDFPELRIEISNGITLCRSCHNKHDPGIKSTQY